MSLYNDASLVMVPSGYKDGTLYSAKPTNGDGDFTFSRGSNLAATRVNSEGLIEKGRENLLLQSNSFDTTWVTSNVSVTSGQSGYDGSSDAWLLSKTSGYANLNQSVSASGVNTYSVYAKANTLNWFRIVGGSTSAFFDLNNGVVGSTDAGNIAKMTSIGSGWYRCEVAMNASTTIMRIYPAQADNDVSGTSGSILIQDAQLEQGLVATDYIETTTTTEQAGILEDMPRLDYSGGATCGSLILEPQRTNNIPQSEYFGSGSGWSLLNNVTLGDFVLSPEGKMNATELVFDGTFGGRIERTIGGLTAAADYSVSIYARVASGTQDVVFGATADETFTLTTDWQRLTRTEAENDANAFPRFRCDDAATIEIFGFQHEAGSYPTSYIPTYGSSVTRSADDCESTSVSSIIGQTEGTLFTQVGDFPQEVNGRIFAISDGSSSNYITIIKSGSNNDFAVYVNDGGVTQVAYTGSASLTGNDKIGVAYANNDYAIYVNGTQVHTDTSASVPACSAIWIGQRENGSKTYIAGGSVKQALLFKTRLTNDELASLTTI